MEPDDYINFVSNFHPTLQFTHTISVSDISFLDINLRITNDHISTSIYYKVTDTHSYLHQQSSHSRHWKDGLPRSQLLRLRRLCSDDSDFLEKGREMISFFCQRGYCAASLQRDLDAIQRSTGSRDLSRIPLVLTFPLSERIKRILLSNFNILSGDPQTKEIFPQPPLVAYRRDRNVRDILVHTADHSQPGPHVGTSPSTHNRCFLLLGERCALVSCYMRALCLRRLTMVYSNFKLLTFDELVLQIFISCCYNNDIEQISIIAE